MARAEGHAEAALHLNGDFAQALPGPVGGEVALRLLESAPPLARLCGAQARGAGALGLGGAAGPGAQALEPGVLEEPGVPGESYWSSAQKK